MSDQPGGQSRLVHWTQDYEETVFYNTNNNDAKMSFALINPKICENSNGNGKRVNPTTSNQCILPHSAGDNAGLKPKMCENSNGNGKGVNPTTSNQCILPQSAGDNAGLKSKMCENSNGNGKRVNSTTSDQCILPHSAGDNAGLKSNLNKELNPVGLLQELCMAYHCPFPLYTFSDKKDHNRFIAVCSISIYKFSGIGITKQVAKRNAAYLMYKQLKKLTPEDFHQIREHNDETPTEYLSLQNEFQCINMLVLCQESVTHLKNYFYSISEPKTPYLQNIKENSHKFKFTAFDTLKTISEIEDFTFNCFIVSQNSDEVNIMMQLNTTPLIVNSGSGKNESDAQESAARIILTFFKIKNNIKYKISINN